MKARLFAGSRLAVLVVASALAGCGSASDSRCPPNGGGLTWSYCGVGASGAVCCSSDTPYWCKMDKLGYADRCYSESDAAQYCSSAAASCE